MTSGEKLPGVLFELASDVQDIVNDKQISPADVPYIKKKVKLDYTSNSLSTTGNYEEVHQKEWATDAYQAVETALDGEKSYEEAIAGVAERGDMEDELARTRIGKFIRKIMDESLSSLSEERIVDIVTIFVSEVDGSPIPWQPRIFLRGVRLEVERVNLTENICLRRPTGADLEEKHDLRRLPLTNRPGTPQNPSAILEFTVKGESNESTLNRFRKIRDTLRLYRLGSVSRTKIEYRPKGILQIAGESHALAPPSTNYRYTLSEEDITDLQEFFEKISPLVGEHLTEEFSDSSDDSFLNIAHDRYQNLIENHGSHEQHITSAIMCLEALLLKEDERGELSERLSKRAGVLLGHLDKFNSIEVANKIRKSYEIRSRYVHGSKIEEEDLDTLSEFVADLAREAILIFVQSQDATEKNNLLNRLDDAALHPDSLSSLSKRLQEEILVN